MTMSGWGNKSVNNFKSCLCQSERKFAMTKRPDMKNYTKAVIGGSNTY